MIWKQYTYDLKAVCIWFESSMHMIWKQYAYALKVIVYNKILNYIYQQKIKMSAILSDDDTIIDLNNNNEILTPNSLITTCLSTSVESTLTDETS